MSIKIKSLVDSKINIDEDIKLINEHTMTPLNKEDVFVFPVEICDNEVDRVGDKMSSEFLQDVASNIAGLTGLKDHDWTSDNQMARLYSAELVEDDTKKNILGESRKYVLGKAYTLSKYKDYIEKINAGLLKESSLSFKSSGDRCSICGCEMIKDSNDIGHCENGHIAGEVYDGVLCYNDINKLDDLMEWSLVAVPCQKGAGIKNKNIGGNIMKKAELLIKQLIHSKNLDDNTAEKLEQVVDAADQVLSEDEIKEIVDENIKLKEDVSKLKAQIKELEDGHTREKITDIVSKGLDELKPLTPKVKELMLKEIPLDDLKLEDGQIPGLDDVFAGIKESYKGLFQAEEVNNESGETSDIANKGIDEAEVVAKENEDTSTIEEKEADKEQVEDKGCGDGDVENKEAPATNVSNKGMHFSNTRVSVGSSNKSVTKKVRSGIVFN